MHYLAIAVGKQNNVRSVKFPMRLKVLELWKDTQDDRMKPNGIENCRA